MNSNTRTIVISVVGVLAAIGLMVGVGIGLARRAGVEDGARTPSVSTVQISPVADLTDFTAVSTAGGWTVEISHGEGFSVDVSASDKARDQVSVFTRGNTLFLELDSGVQSVTGNLKASVVLPDLRRLQTAGGANVVISGFELDTLDIEVDGAATITGRDGSINQLTIQSEGASNFSFDDIEVRNADVHMDGASNLDITMSGGVLTGALRGLGNVTFRGEVSQESIRIDGLGRVRRQ